MTTNAATAQTLNEIAAGHYQHGRYPEAAAATEALYFLEKVYDLR